MSDLLFGNLSCRDFEKYKNIYIRIFMYGVYIKIIEYICT